MIYLMVPFAAPTHAQTTPFFSMTLIIPNNDQTRMIWSTQIAAAWIKLGIDVNYVYLPWSSIDPRRTGTTLGLSYANGGFDAYTERYYYDTITPDPFELFHSSQFPPGGLNYGLLNSTALDKIIDNYDSASSQQDHLYWISQFEQWWIANLPALVVYYPEDVIAIDPNMQGFLTRDGSTWDWLFFPHPEEWTVPNKTTGGFAVCCPAAPFLPPYSTGYDTSDVFSPTMDALYQYQGWFNKTLVPDLATGVNISPDGSTWVINLRQGVQWHDGWPFNATDVQYTFDLVMNKAYGSIQQAELTSYLGGPQGVTVTGPYQITLHLAAPYSPVIKEFILATLPIMPWHAYKNLGPADIGVGGTHPANTWEGTYTVTKPDGSLYVAHGPIGTGPWIAMGYDPVKQVFSYVRNYNYWRPTPGNLENYNLAIINGAAGALGALRSGEVQAMDTSYSIQSLISTIDPSWGKVVTSDSAKWVHVMLNMQNPYFGTGTGTPLGTQDPSRAAEAALDVREALNWAIPRDQIINQTLRGYGTSGTVPLPFTSVEYNHTLLPANMYHYDFDQAMAYMAKAGYSYAPAAPPSFMELYGNYLLAAIAVAVVVIAGISYFALRSRSKKS